MNRKVVMYMEIGCFVCCLCGWILICSTMPTEYWNFSEVGSVVMTTSNYFSNLWMDCVSDTTGVSDCKYFPSMLALPVFLHVCRALAVVSVILGFWGAVLTLIGMKCTKIGGSELANARVTFAASLTYLASGLSGMTVYSMYGNNIRAEFVDPNFKLQKFEIGAAVFIGWGGSSLIILGSAVMCYFSGKEGLRSSSKNRPNRPKVYIQSQSRGSYVTARTRGSYVTAQTRPSYMTAKTRGTYKTPSSFRPTVIMPPLLQSAWKLNGEKTAPRTYRSNINKTTAPVQLIMDSYV